MIIRMFLKNLKFQFSSNNFWKVMFKCVEVSCSFKLFRNFIPKRKISGK